MIGPKHTIMSWLKYEMLAVVFSKHSLVNSDFNDFFLVYRAHPFTKKEWYNVLAPGFDKRNITLTPANKTIGNKLAADNI